MTINSKNQLVSEKNIHNRTRGYLIASFVIIPIFCFVLFSADLPYWLSLFLTILVSLSFAIILSIKFKKLKVDARKESQLYQSQLKHHILKLGAIYEHSPDTFIWNLNEKLEIIGFNKYFYLALEDSINRRVKENVSFDQLFSGRISELGLLNFKEKFISVFQNGISQSIEGKLYDAKGHPTWFETFITPIFNENKKVVEIVCISHNTSEKRNYQKKLEKSLKEQETLLQEVHHRVKNNLQVVSSILSLQSSFVKDESVLLVIRESQNRIKSMSFIHESLYINKDFSSINFKDYMLNLINNLVHSYQIFDNQVKVNSEIEAIKLSLDQSIPCGLILNEVVSNALKHAFPESKKDNKIEINVKEIDGLVQINVADNGVGLPNNFKPEESQSLGMQLIFTLIDQLDGNIELTSEVGTKYLITFELQK